MSTRITIGLIGDHSDAIVAHRAIPQALQLAAASCGIEVEPHWVPSQEITSSARIARFDGLWCVPGSPYRSMDGVLHAIRYAREQQRPLLGTCGGFQHALIEYARNVLGWSDADHAESSPDAGRAVIAPLACALLDQADTVRLVAGSRLAHAYAASEIAEEYLCSFGVNPEFRAALVSGPLREAAVDAQGDLRGVELEDHRFFVATLFQPERAALRGVAPPPVTAFVQACSR
jgi:CTP synthase (UTP-ammonia lyase)